MEKTGRMMNSHANTEPVTTGFEFKQLSDHTNSRRVGGSLTSCCGMSRLYPYLGGFVLSCNVCDWIQGMLLNRKTCRLE